jgi:hypothetical protein
VTANDGTAIAFDRLGDGPPVIWCAAGRPTGWSTRPWRRCWPGGSRCSTTTVGLEATAGTRPPIPSSARSRISMRSSPWPVARRACGAAPPGRPWRSKPPPVAWHQQAGVVGAALPAQGWRPRPPADTAKVFTELISQGRRGDAVEFFMAKVVRLPDEFSPRRATRRSGRHRRPRPTRWPTTPPSWVTMRCRPRGSPRSQRRRCADRWGEPPMAARHGTSDGGSAAKGAAPGPGRGRSTTSPRRPSPPR